MKFVTADEAVAVIKSNDRVFVHSVAAAPQRLVRAMAARAAELRGVEVVHLHTGTFSATEQFRNWAEYVGEYKPVLLISAQPVLGESFWGAVGRGVAANYGIRSQANLRFKTDFYKMKLFCGDKMVEPIHPAKIFFLTNESNYFVKSKDATYVGFYSYPADAINEGCGTVRLELYSEKHPDKAETKTLGKKTVAKVVSDFEPYFKSRP